MTETYPDVLPSKIQGFGLFAEKDYHVDDFVTWYGGVHFPKDSLDLLSPTSLYKIRSSDGSTWDSAVVFDSTRERGRWINDHVRGFEESHPYNTKFMDTGSSGMGIFIRAIREVKKGEEFVIDYGDEYWKKLKV